MMNQKTNFLKREHTRTEGRYRTTTRQELLDKGYTAKEINRMEAYFNSIGRKRYE